MGWVARIVACGSALSVVACAAIAGLQDPQTADLTSTDDGDGSVPNTSSSGGGSSSSGGSSGASSSSGATSSGGDGSSPQDATSDAPIDTGPTCTLFKNGDTCQAASQCCSNKCNEDRKCATDCKAGNQFGCNPASNTSCCVGFWCTTTSQCAACVTSGQAPGETAGLPNPFSCCSRTINPMGGTCQ